ncbi:stalk domain-containing protein [Cohnella panacarvi]|uniref:stalk domain-containing protein n=1 Tax=Cohnella panacarvi TaxID=400776 RepID=UPI00047EE504|nr:DUF4163 domain-containing protein [Cohnella panacarvi]
MQMQSSALSDRTRKLLLSLAVVMAFPAASAIPQGIASAAVTKYSTISQPFKINGTSFHIGTINKNGSTYIALRSIDSALGLTTRYDPSSRLVQVTGRNRSIRIGLSTGAISLNGQPIFGPEPILQNGTTYLPLRFLSERFGYEVTYDKGSKLIGLHALKENELSISAETIGADGDDKSLSVYYPVLSGLDNAEVQRTINSFLKQEADRFVTAGSEQMNPVVQANDDLLAENPNAQVRRPTFDGRYTVTYNEKGLLSLYADYSVYLGGAHSNTARVAYTFDLSTGERLSLKDVAGERTDYVTTINEAIKKQIADRGLTLHTPFKTIEPDRDFFLRHNGAVVYFTQYEYTSFADGMPEFVIPYSAFSRT